MWWLLNWIAGAALAWLGWLVITGELSFLGAVEWLIFALLGLVVLAMAWAVTLSIWARTLGGPADDQSGRLYPDDLDMDGNSGE